MYFPAKLQHRVAMSSAASQSFPAPRCSELCFAGLTGAKSFHIIPTFPTLSAPCTGTRWRPHPPERQSPIEWSQSNRSWPQICVQRLPPNDHHLHHYHYLHHWPSKNMKHHWNINSSSERHQLARLIQAHKISPLLAHSISQLFLLVIVTPGWHILRLGTPTKPGTDTRMEQGKLRWVMTSAWNPKTSLRKHWCEMVQSYSCGKYVLCTCDGVKKTTQ